MEISRTQVQSMFSNTGFMGGLNRKCLLSIFDRCDINHDQKLKDAELGAFLDAVKFTSEWAWKKLKNFVDNSRPATGTNPTNQSASRGPKIVETARKYIGYNEANGSADMFWREIGNHYSNFSYYKNWNSRTSDWCAAFVTYVLTQNGIDLSDCDGPGWVPSLKKWGEKHGKYVSSNNATPNNIKPGDVVLYPNERFNPSKPESTSNYRFRHTGIVTKVYPNGTFDTIEGNSDGGKVCEVKGLSLKKYHFVQTA